MPSTEAEGEDSPFDHVDAQHVVVAVIENAAGEVLISQRHQQAHQGGLWEFPGGKVKPNESVIDALRRELTEELAIFPLDMRPLIRLPYHYPEQTVLLDVWRVNRFRGEPHGVEGQPVRWLSKRQLRYQDFPAANRAIITATQLPPCYLITPDPGTPAQWPEFLHQLRQSLQSGVSLLQFRAPSLDPEEYLRLAREVARCCQEQGALLLLNADVSLLSQCEASGVHLNSRRLMAATRRPLDEGQLLGVSCHSLEELRQAERIGADFALFSPVKTTASHTGVAAVGWSTFQRMSEASRLPLYALGGMSQEDCQQAWQRGGQGIAAIRSLWGVQGVCAG